MTKVEQLTEYLNVKFKLQLDSTTFYRTRVGYWQKGHGAWSWWMYEVKSKGNIYNYGSRWTVTELLKNKDNIVLSNNEFIKN